MHAFPLESSGRTERTLLPEGSGSFSTFDSQTEMQHTVGSEHYFNREKHYK